MEIKELIFPEAMPDMVSEWDKYVPIVQDKDSSTVTVFLFNNIEAPGAYAELVYTLEHTAASKVVLKINNGGGVLDSCLSVTEAIKNCKATVIADLSGTVASAATMIALACDEIILADSTSFMIHSASGGYGGKMHESKAYMEFSDKEMKKMFKDIYANFLTSRELKLVLEGKDMWMNKKDVLTRWDKRANIEGA